MSTSYLSSAIQILLTMEKKTLDGGKDDESSPPSWIQSLLPKNDGEEKENRKIPNVLGLKLKKESKDVSRIIAQHIFLLGHMIITFFFCFLLAHRPCTYVYRFFTHKGVNELAWFEFEGKKNPNRWILIQLFCFSFKFFFFLNISKSNWFDQEQIGLIQVIRLKKIKK